MPLTWEYESEYRKTSVVCGCDEAGRGPLAGPVYAAAVILPDGADICGLDDSKKLSAKQREAVRGRILETELDSAVAFATVEEIESLNILGASLLAMRRAVEALRIRPSLLLIDGNVARGFAEPAVAVIGGDAKYPSVAAASVLAKTARDAYCIEADAQYPQYGFAQHKGYGTKAHRAAILQYGPCPLHRKSFLKKLWEKV